MDKSHVLGELNTERIIGHVLAGVVPPEEFANPEGYAICRINLRDLIVVQSSLEDLARLTYGETSFFRESPYFIVLRILIEYGLKTGAPCSYSAMITELEKLNVSKAKGDAIMHAYQEARGKSKNRRVFSHSLNEYIQYVKCLRFSNLLADSGSIFGERHDQGDLHGAFSKSYEYLLKGIRTLTFDGLTSGAEGYLHEDGTEILERYLQEKRSPPGMTTGIDDIDSLTNGQKPSELWLIGGYTGQGKSVFITNDSLHKSVVLGKNVLIVSAEMSKARYQDRLICRHSRNPKFEGHEVGLDFFRTVNRRLGAQEEALYTQVVDDLTQNPAYGRLYIWRASAGATMGDVTRKAEEISEQHPVDAIYIDYLQLLRSSRNYRDPRDDLKAALEEANELSLTFGGKGTVVVSAWQISRDGYKYAKEHKEYDFPHFAETSGAERTADVLMWIYRDDTLKELNRAKLGVLKNRDGIAGKSWEIYADYASQYIRSIATE